MAFAGSVIVWTRFYAAQVPPDQVVAAYPRSELVAIASALLLLFGFVGILAVVVFYLINREGGATIGMSRGLLGLLAAEGIVAILLVESSSWEDRVIACELFLLPTVVACWATFLYERPALTEDSPNPPDESEEGSGLVEMVGDLGSDFVESFMLRSRFVHTVVNTVFLVAFVAAVLLLFTGIPGSRVVIGGLALIGLLPTLRLFLLWMDKPGEPQTLESGKVPFTRRGQTLILALLPVAAIGPSLVLGSSWLTVSLLAAAGLIAGLWRVAVLSKNRFRWYGLSVFVSVLLFGTVTGVVRNIADPQVQPMALIRTGDGPDESIQGLYVTETDDRIYFATVATEGCSDELVPHSGRLLWVPKSEVVAMSIGPLQNVADAAKTALEMSYALTPAVETPAGNHVSLTVAEKSKADEPPKGSPLADRRLESVGAAVQPNFGAGLRLDPESASPGDVVTLRMSAPNRQDQVNGFGPSREARTLRLGGVPADIVKEEAHSPFDAEYLESSDGDALNLAKGALYSNQNGHYIEVSQDQVSETDALYVKVDDRAVEEVKDNGLAEGDYLRLADGAGRSPRLATFEGRAPEVVLRNGTTLSLKSRLLRQDWHEDRIKFRVPKHAATGPVTVECEQLAGQPLLQVARPPRARITVQIEPGSRRILFDSSPSADYNGKIVSRQWSIEGLDSGHGVRITESLSPRIQGYTVRLEVTDSEGQVGTTELHLLRLPARLMSFEHHRSSHPRLFREAKIELEKATASAPAAAIEFDVRPGERPSPQDPDVTIRRAEQVRRGLLRAGAAQSSTAPADPDGLIVKTLAFGASCPAEHESPEGRFDVLVLGQGVDVLPPRVCPVVRLRARHWLLPPP